MIVLETRHTFLTFSFYNKCQIDEQTTLYLPPQKVRISHLHFADGLFFVIFVLS